MDGRQPAKLAMALYREHVGHALPLTGGVHTNWYLNAGLAQRTAEGILKTLPLGGTLRQGSFQVAAIGFAAISSIALAGDDREDLSSATAPLPPGTFTTSAHSDEWKIANALSAGPASITDHATVIDWPANPKDGMSHGGCFAKAPTVGHACPTFPEGLSTTRCAWTRP